jgi:hypothetical protein
MPPVIIDHPNTIRGPIELTHNELRDAREKQYVDDKTALDEDFHADLAVLRTNKENALKAAGLNADGGVPSDYPAPQWLGTPAQTGGGTTGDTQTVTNPASIVGGEASFTYQWMRDGVAIGGATASTRVLAGADEGKSIKCRVTAVGADSATSYRDTNAIVAAP